MDCTNCALDHYPLSPQKRIAGRNEKFIGGDVSFETDGTRNEELSKGIADLGYKVVSETISTRYNMLHSNITVFRQPPATIPALPAIYPGTDAAHAALASSIPDESLDPAGDLHPGIPS